MIMLGQSSCEFPWR